MRVDLRGDQIVAFSQEQRSVGMTLPIAVEMACGLSKKKPAQKTYVIADDFWTGVIDLDERSIYGLEGAELEQMLRFETESLSDLDPMNSRMGFVELTSVSLETRRFWGVAVPNEVLSGVARAVLTRGGKLELLAHPIGLSHPDHPGVPWIEFTPEMAGAFAAPSDTDKLPRGYVTQRSSASNRWFEVLETMFGGELPANGWQSSAADQPTLYAGTLESLDDEQVRLRWVRGLAKRVTNEGGFPYLAAPQIPTSTKAIATVGAVAALVVASICGAFAVTMKSRVSELQMQIAKLEGPTAEKKGLDKQIKELQEQVNELSVTAEQSRFRRDNLRVLVDQGDRFSVLLRALADRAESNLVVDAITPTKQGMTLSGREIRTDAVTQMVQQVEPKLAEVGWAVRPPSVTGSNQTKAGGPWVFEVELIDQRPKVPTVDAPHDTPVASLLSPSNMNQQGND